MAAVRVINAALSWANRVKTSSTGPARNARRVADPVTASSVAVTVDAGSFRSNNAKRDTDVRSASLYRGAARRRLAQRAPRGGRRQAKDHPHPPD